MRDTTVTTPAGSSLDIEFERVAETTGHSKSDIALRALVSWLEDQADAVAADRVFARYGPTTSLAEMRRRFGLER